jgi:hypothetical protein
MKHFAVQLREKTESDIGRIESAKKNTVNRP